MHRHQETRFYTLDLLRGIAAAVVLSLHFAWPDGGDGPLQRAYLSVDLFFCISGFVIAHSYLDRLRDGMSVGRFFLIRMIRLYPVYLLGMALIGVSLAVSGNNASLTEVPTQRAIAVAAGFLMLPTPPGMSSWNELYPMNGPAWSLLWELLVNIALALFARAMGVRWLLVVIVLSAVTLAGVVRLHDSVQVGFRWDSFLAAAPRTGYSFFAGVALNLLWRRLPRFRVPVSPWVLAGVLLAVVSVSYDMEHAALYDLGVVLGLIPVLVFVGASSEGGRLTNRCSAFLGELSYPFYILQIPVMTFIQSVLGIELDGWLPWGLVLWVVVLVGVIAGVLRWYDRPVRRWLSAKLLHRPVAVEAAETAP
jgi:peptidoglycan/LPS O-acetylase OafA/YrhL